MEEESMVQRVYRCLSLEKGKTVAELKRELHMERHENPFVYLRALEITGCVKKIEEQHSIRYFRTDQEIPKALLDLERRL